jgi:hypothetical protein
MGQYQVLLDERKCMRIDVVNFHKLAIKICNCWLTNLMNFLNQTQNASHVSDLEMIGSHIDMFIQTVVEQIPIIQHNMEQLIQKSIADLIACISIGISTTVNVTMAIKSDPSRYVFWIFGDHVENQLVNADLSITVMSQALCCVISIIEQQLEDDMRDRGHLVNISFPIMQCINKLRAIRISIETNHDESIIKKSIKRLHAAIQLTTKHICKHVPIIKDHTANVMRLQVIYNQCDSILGFMEAKAVMYSVLKFAQNERRKDLMNKDRQRRLIENSRDHTFLDSYQHRFSRLSKMVTHACNTFHNYCNHSALESFLSHDPLLSVPTCNRFLSIRTSALYRWPQAESTLSRLEPHERTSHEWIDRVNVFLRYGFDQLFHHTSPSKFQSMKEYVEGSLLNLSRRTLLQRIVNDHMRLKKRIQVRNDHLFFDDQETMNQVSLV